MKHARFRLIVGLFILVIALNGCHRSATLPVQNGDLLFIGLPYNFTFDDSCAVSGNNDLNYIHVAILEVDERDSIWVIDATIKHGVDRYPLSTFLSDFTLEDGSYPQMDVMRLKNNRQAAKYVEKAKTYCGRPYDIYFSPDNEEQFCSELVRNAYCKGDSRYLFEAAPMDFTAADGTFPPYWVYLFNCIGQPIPQGHLGTTPNGISQAPCLTKVATLEQPEQLLNH